MFCGYLGGGYGNIDSRFWFRSRCLTRLLTANINVYVGKLLWSDVLYLGAYEEVVK